MATNINALSIDSTTLETWMVDAHGKVSRYYQATDKQDKKFEEIPCEFYVMGK